MWYFHNWSAAAFLYLGLHGTYTLLWLVKQFLFADKRFAQLIPLRIGLLTPFLPLMAYMIGPYLLISEHTVPPNWVFALASFLCISGVFLHFVGDAQKFFVLQLRIGLIEDGLFARTRNPNYLGEVLIYAGFSLASWHWEPFVVLADGFCTLSVTYAGKTSRCLAILSSLRTKLGRECSCPLCVWVLRGPDPLSRSLQLRTSRTGTQ
jgi:protein-S-isoprenylcysteine O-methyltransferase Ste14